MRKKMKDTGRALLPRFDRKVRAPACALPFAVKESRTEIIFDLFS